MVMARKRDIAATAPPMAMPAMAPVERGLSGPGVPVGVGGRVGVLLGMWALRVMSTRRSALLKPESGAVFVAPPSAEPPMAAMMGSGTAYWVMFVTKIFQSTFSAFCSPISMLCTPYWSGTSHLSLLGNVPPMTSIWALSMTLQLSEW
jgi:hypothetical protein